MATILHHGSVQAACFLNDLTKVVTCNGDGQVKVWDINSGEVLHRFTGHKAPVSSLALSPDGDYLASGSEDGAVKIWDMGVVSADDETDNDIEKQKEALSKCEENSGGFLLRFIA